MSRYLKGCAAAALFGVGIFASAGSAYAAGCLPLDQMQYSLSDFSDTAKDAERAAELKGFHCPVYTSTAKTSQHVLLQKSGAATKPA